MLKVEDLPNDGAWWLDEWWKDPNEEFFCNYPRDQVKFGVGVLKHYFDAEWACSLVQNNQWHPLLAQLFFERGSRSLNLFAYFGKVLSSVENCHGFTKKLEDLKDEKFESTYFELDIANAFLESGYAVSFPIEGTQKSHDVLAVRGDVSFAIECKRLQAQEWEQWEERLTHKLIQNLYRSVEGRQLQINVTLNPRLTEVRIGDQPELSDGFANALIQKITHEIDKKIATHLAPFNFELGDIAHIDVNWETENTRGSVMGMERSTPALFRRIFQNGILRAIPQLPEDQPGIIFIYTDQLPSTTFFHTLFDSACSTQIHTFEKLLCVVLCARQTIFSTTAPIAYFNRNSKYAHLSNLAQVVLKTLGAKI
ncbi:MAG: hypothetical protein V4454_11090 [Pseudomonadota bacterium]